MENKIIKSVKRYKQFFRKHGLKLFIQKVLKRMNIIDKSISAIEFDYARKKGILCFDAYVGLQGALPRHHYMVETVKHLKDRGEINILEIGSWAGLSAITWCEACNKYLWGRFKLVCVDPWTDYLKGIDGGYEAGNEVLQKMRDATKYGEIISLFHHNIRVSGYEDKVFPFKGNFEEIYTFFKEKSFDIIFIDGPHDYNSVLTQLNISSGLLKDGGILCGDDLDMQLYEVDKIRCKEKSNIADCTVDPKTNKLYHPGVTLAVWNFFNCDVSAYKGFWLMTQKKGGWERVENLNKVKTWPKHLLKYKDSK